MTVIVAGKVYVEPGERDRFVAGHRELVLRCRERPGCLDLAISPDPVEPGRVNLFEHWESEEALAAWRAIAPAPAVDVEITDDQVLKHEVASSGPPFG
ncbi:putative quinol monooxygenase [Amycolatopsis cihanbeyliensis]|uniref:Antibiotic biosynthesis monooxygenase n=1 Tax=Amycolatopsis cihanbeyliensis TaxID=1128664 RepID=A0A542DHW2_AMYCI|nr:antibiotic biosynthesis monooxygenase [Amycolatopsis cihanbeyliensis]TQJ02687.1 antibiotic biosynthesis monooxygenase [Amycolatopsis cihanbeyliensis]